MTEEEKIICKSFLHDADNTRSCNEYKLLMELLEQEPTTKNDLEVDWESYKDVDGNSLDDLILEVLQNNFDCGNTYGYKVADEIIGLLPSVTPQEPSWIPIDEKRPSGFEKVLVAYRLHCDDSIHVGFGGIECNLFNGKYYWDINEQVIGWDVLAWMPLPEPYKGGQEE